MLFKSIYTRLHKEIEFHSEDSKFRKFAKSIEELPYYVFDMELYNHVVENQEAIEETFKLLFEFDKLNLPANQIAVELWKGNSWKEKYGDFRFFLTIQPLELTESEEKELDITYESDSKFKSFLVSTLLKEFPVFVRYTYYYSGARTGWVNVWTIDHKGQLELSDIEEFRKNLENYFRASLILSLMLSNKNLFDQKIVEPKSLNRERAKKKKGAIKDHILVRLGTVYDREGKKVSIGLKSTVKAHLRAAHSQMQPHGLPWIKANPEEAKKSYNTATHHLVYKEAILVNYKEGEELPKTKRRIVKL